MNFYTPIVVVPLLLFSGCSLKPTVSHPLMPETTLQQVYFDQLQGWESEDVETLRHVFAQNCKTEQTAALYGALCEEVNKSVDARAFFEAGFRPYRINPDEKDGLLTGYYEPLLFGSLERSDRYRFPLYGVPEDLITVNLGNVYEELHGMRLRGRLDGKRLVPYHTREEIAEQDDLPVICWVDNNIARYFLEVQGSGRIELDNGEVMYVGYADQNGHPYRSIGKYLVEENIIPEDEISLQAIRKWLEENPDKMDILFNINPSQVFFQRREQGASGSLGLELFPKRSVAVDRRYIPLGSLLYIESKDPLSDTPMQMGVAAMDTGGAIKGRVRADLFWGFGADAEKRAGKMKAPLKMWILLPKTGQLR